MYNNSVPSSCARTLWSSMTSISTSRVPNVVVVDGDASRTAPRRARSRSRSRPVIARIDLDGLIVASIVVVDAIIVVVDDDASRRRGVVVAREDAGARLGRGCVPRLVFRFACVLYGPSVRPSVCLVCARSVSIGGV